MFDDVVRLAGIEAAGPSVPGAHPGSARTDADRIDLITALEQLLSTG